MDTSLQDITDFHDVVRLLEQHPEWRAELRRLVLTEELLALPDQLAELARQVTRLTEAQARVEERLVRTEERLVQIEERLVQIEERLVQIEDRQTRTEEWQARTEEWQAQIEDRQARTETRLDSLTGVVKRLSDDVGTLKGKGLETHYRLHGSPFFGSLLRRPHVLSLEEVSDILDPNIDQGSLSSDEALEIRRADLVVRGTRREDRKLVYLAVEVSWTVDLEDVERAARRGAYLAKTGLSVLPVVAGETIRPGAADRAQDLKVWQMTNADLVEPDV